MGAKKEKAVKEKPLNKLTSKELREMALALGGIVGVHAMNKNELVAVIKEAKGITEEKTKKSEIDVRALKAKIQELRDKKATAAADSKKKLADVLRRRISNLKKKTRKAA